MSIDSAKFIKAVNDLRRDVDGLMRPQLGRSSLEDAFVNSYDANGVITGRIGRQYDGSDGAVVLNGPKPPTPQGLTLTPIIGGVTFHWGGEWVQVEGDPGLAPTPTVAPQDFMRIECYLTTEPEFTEPTFDLLRGSIENARGGEANCFISPAVGDGYYGWIVCRARSGKLSDVFGPIGPVQPRKAAASELDVDLSQIGGNKIFWGTETPVADKIGDLWLMYLDDDDDDTPLYETYRWNGLIWALVRDQDVTQAILQAELAATVAAGKLTLFEQDTEPTGLSLTAKALWVDTDDGNRQRTWNGVAWVDRRLGNGAIEPGSLIASDVIATGTISAALLEALLILATVIILGDPNGEHVRLDPTGLTAYVEDPVDGVPNEIFRAGRQVGGADSITGRQTWNVDEQGNAAFQSLAVTEDILVGGRALSELLVPEASSRQVARGQVTLAGQTGISTAEIGLFEIAFTAEPGHTYSIHVEGVNVAGFAEHDDVWFYMRNGGTTRPLLTSPIQAGPFYSHIPATERFKHHNFEVFLMTHPLTSTAAQQRILVTMKRGAGGSGTLQLAACTPIVSIRDEGFAVPNVAVLNDGSPLPGGEPDDPGPVSTKDETYSASWSQSYYGDGTKRTDTSDAMQGYTPYFSSGGNQRSIIGFPDLTAKLNKAGTTIELIEISFYANHWHYNAGGTAIIGSHGNSSAPPTFNGTPDLIRVAKWGPNTRRTINVTTWANGMKAGTIRGFVLGPGPSTASEYYGRFNGASMSNAPKLRIKYTN